MIKIILFFFSLFFSQQYNCQTKNTQTIEYVEKYQKLELTRSILLSLSSDYYKGRNVLDSNIALAQSYIMNVLKSQRIVTYDTGYCHTYSIRDSIFSKNIIAVHRGDKKSKKIILIIANYDNLGTIYEANNDDHIYNGANDNMSGTVALIQMAIFFSRIKINKNIVFAFTSGKRY